MLEGGIRIDVVRNMMKELGVPSDKVDQVINSFKETSTSKNGDEESSIKNDVQEEQFPAREELRRQRLMIEGLQQETEKIKLEISRLFSMLEALKTERTQNFGIRIGVIEAKVDGLIEAVGEYVPSILKKVSASAQDG
jgi:predicted RNase H-like nuclease (RuvC/YqgF family)